MDDYVIAALQRVIWGYSENSVQLLHTNSKLLIILSLCMYYVMLAFHSDKNETRLKAVWILVEQVKLILQDVSLHL